MGCYMQCKNADKIKVNGIALGFLTSILLVGGGLTGCSTGGAVKTDTKTADSSKPKVRHEVVVINNQPAAPAPAAGQPAGKGKDQHHLEFEKKRMWYNQKWVVQQESERNAKRAEYQRKFQQEQLAQQQVRPPQAQAAVVSAQPRIPHYGFGSGQNYANNQSPAPARSNRVNVNLAEHLSNAAIARTYQRVRYDGRYMPIAYPMGDVPSSIGVCTDTVIRSYRRLGIDLQRLVHEDMVRAFYAYPNLPKWGLAAPDPNIDHRRVHNLKAFFARHGQRLPVTHNPQDYRPGDLVTWYLGGDQEHIGIVVNRRSPDDPNRYMIVHNIADGDKMEDVLFRMPISGHYRFLPNRNQPWLAAAY
ncbi:MAG: DUF1287 domain-containing protein [Thiolinea sp.]